VADEPHDSRWSIHPEGQWIIGNHPEATPQQLEQLTAVLQKNKAAFAYSMKDLPAYTGPLGPAHFDLITDKPMWSPQRRYTPDELTLGDSKVQEMLEADIIVEVPTTNRHASAVTMPMKRAPDGSWTDKRFCIDLRQVNANTVQDRYGMPLPEELFQRIGKARYLTKLDMRSGFFAIALDEEAQSHTAFWWRGKLYAYRRLPFGHVNSTAVFQRRMEMELQRAGLAHCTVVFVDDILLFSDTMEQHLQQLDQLLQHFASNNLRAHPAKTIAGANCLPYLGHLLAATAQEIRPDPAKVSAMAALRPPDSIKRLQAHLGLFNYYRCYIPQFSIVARPLYQLLQQGAQYSWQAEQQQAYDQLKAALTKPGTALRQPDGSKPFVLYTDWSTQGIAAVLNQSDDDGNEYMVACTSRSLNPAERNYAAWKGELLAVIHGLKAFRPYLLTREFTLVTDHRALLWLLTHKQPVGQQARWLLSISEFRFSLQHRAGVDNPADVPSREPQACTADWTGSRLDGPADVVQLPAVRLADGTPDPVSYSHDQLALDLCVRQPPQPRSSKTINAQHQAASAVLEDDYTAALAAAVGTQRPSAILAAEASVCPPSLPFSLQAEQSLFQLLDISDGAGSSVSTFMLPPGSLMGGEDAAQQQSFLAAAAIQHCSSSSTASDSNSNAATAGSNSTAWQPVCPHSGGPDTDRSPAVAWEQQQLRRAATTWVQQACSAPAPPAGPTASRQPPLAASFSGQADSNGVRHTVSISTASVASTFFPAALTQGVVLYEPCGGLCAGLEMALRNGARVQRYLYSDIDPAAQRVAAHRVRQLQTSYPDLLEPAALAASFSSLPADIRNVTAQHLAAAVQQQPGQQWLVVAGWPCQDFSSAGHGRGMQGSRAQLLHNVVHIVGTLQQLCPSQPPAYLLENVALQLHQSPHISVDAFNQVCQMIGQPVFIDAAQFGSLAHRPRNFWSNLCSPQQLRGALAFVQRPAGRNVGLALQPGRLAFPVQRPDRPPQHRCNEPGQQRAAWPTIMSRTQSYAFRPGQPGSVIDCSQPPALAWDEPNAHEREVALGYLPGSTAAEGISEQQRRQVLGQAIDANVLQGIMAISQAWWFACSGNQPPPAWLAAAAQSSQQQPAALGELSSSANHPSYSVLCNEQQAAAAQESLAAGTAGRSEVWTDHPTLTALQQGQLPPALSHAERTRVQKRLKLYLWDQQQQQLIRRMPDGSRRSVPPPGLRQQLVQQQHELGGHFGCRRTATLLATKYWWHGMLADVEAVVGRCEHCSRVKASFASSQPELQSIPISSLGFRWHVDLCGPFPVSQRGHQFIMVAVEAFSKHLEAVPIPDKQPATVAYAFLTHVLSKFAAPGQVVTDNGAEFQGAFAQLLADSLIDHCHTSVAHPRANGLAERAVQTVKTALRALCQQREKLADWDTDVAWLALGYRCSKHRGSGFSPYELLFARPPVMPPAISSRMAEPINYDNAEQAAADLQQRRQLVQRLMPEALSNLSIAQHRDQQRYAVVRLGAYRPRVHRFQAGDFVYLQQHQQHNALQPKARPNILRVAQVTPAGVLLLQGKCGRFTEARQEHCAPCHLPGLDSSIDPVLAFDSSTVCEVCCKERPIALLLLCDVCNKGWHTQCLQPPLSAVPAGTWICPPCAQAGATAADVSSRQQQRQEEQQRRSLPNLFPDAGAKRRDQEAASLHGQLIRKAFRQPRSNQQRVYWGRLHYRGPQFRPNYFLVIYEDGDDETLTTAQARKLLPASTEQPPPGTSIPALTQEQILQCTAAAACVQHHAAAALTAVQQQATQPPPADVRLLLSSVDFSRVVATADPVCGSQPLQRQHQQQGQQHQLQPPRLPGAAYLMAVQPSAAAAAIAAALSQQPAFLACYVPGQQLPAAVQQLLQQQRSPAVLRGMGGSWVCVAAGVLDISSWLLH
jgi:hypothetical protein